MQKELDTKDNYPIQYDDLKFDGKNMIIPANWANSIHDFLRNVNTVNIDDVDQQDLHNLKEFIDQVASYAPQFYKKSSYHFEETN